jgi:hypothetical protein
MPARAGFDDGAMGLGALACRSDLRQDWQQPVLLVDEFL